MKTAWLITTYKQAKEVKDSIVRIRNYPKLNDVPIICVSTAVEDIFKNFTTDGFYPIHFKNAPGNPDTNFISKSYDYHPNPVVVWRDAYLAARIILSMRLGFLKAEELGCDTVIHLHSDGYWEDNKLDFLIETGNLLLDQNRVFYADRSRSCEFNNLLPALMHFHPEGSIFNLVEARKYNYGFNFDEIYDTPNTTKEIIDLNQFYTLHFGRTESLFSTWLLWCLTKKGVLKPTDLVDSIYYDKIHAGMVREPWGHHPHGLVNYGQQLEF